MEMTRSFFDVLECPSEGVEFMIDQERLLKLLKLSLGEQWAQIDLNTEKKRLVLKIMKRGGWMMNLNCVYHVADYGEGFVSRDRVYRNVINMDFGEFEYLLESWKMFVCFCFLMGSVWCCGV